MKKVFSIILMSLISILIFSFDALEINASDALNVCLYENRAAVSYVGVNSSGGVYSFNNTTGTLGSSLGSAIDGNYEVSACSRRIYQYSNNDGTIFSTVDCNPGNWSSSGGFSVTPIIPDECKFLTGNNTNSIAAQAYAGSYKKTDFDRVRSSELTEFNERAAAEARTVADTEYVSCLNTYHRTSYQSCQSLSENITEIISCVKTQVENSGGTYRCEDKEQSLIAADRTYRSAKAGSLIAINLGEMSCEDLLSSEFVDELKSLFTIIQVLGISIAIVLTAVDFMRFVFGGDEDKYKAMFKNLKIRIAVIILLMIVPYLIEFILSNTMGGDVPTNPFCE